MGEWNCNVFCCSCCINIRVPVTIFISSMIFRKYYGLFDNFSSQGYYRIFSKAKTNHYKVFNLSLHFGDNPIYPFWDLKKAFDLLWAILVFLLERSFSVTSPEVIPRNYSQKQHQKKNNSSKMLWIFDSWLFVNSVHPNTYRGLHKVAALV